MSTSDITGATGPTRPPNLPLRPDQLIGLARGFRWMAGGLLLTFLLLFGLLEWNLPRLGFSMPTCTLGAVVSLFGGTLWWRAAEQLRPWQGCARWAVWLAALQIYFAPFALWWRHDLGDIQLFLNSMALLVCLMLQAWLLTRQAEETGRIFADHGLTAEARFGRRALIVPVLILTLMLAGYETPILAGAAWPEPPSVSLPGMALPPWLIMAQLGSILMTISICWRCTQACHQALIHSAKRPVNP